jgi:hypothetical protein
MRYAGLVGLVLIAQFAAACSSGSKETGGAAKTVAATATMVATASTGGDGDSEDGEGDTGTGGAPIDASGDVSGSLILSGLSCDLGVNGAQASDDQYIVSISGTIDEEQVTIDIQAGPAFPVPDVRLTRTGGSYAKWSNEQSGKPVSSGTVNVSDIGGDLDYDLHPAEIDPGGAAGTVTLAGGWTCPGGQYKPIAP